MSFLQNEQLVKHFVLLSEWLEQNRNFWIARPFVSLPVPWEEHYPNLSESLRNLSVGEIELYEQHPEKIPHMQKWNKEAKSFTADVLGKDFITKPLPKNVLFSLKRKIPERKWQQIIHFIQSLPDIDSSVIDWCAGKGHLGRTLISLLKNKKVYCLEKQAALCQAGKKLATEFALAETLDMVCCDVLEDDTQEYFDNDVTAIALHACGNLHLQLIENCLARDARALFFAPCCYHRMQVKNSDYSPLSSQGQKFDLRLNQAALRLATAEEVVASTRRRELRRRELAWRLGFDLLRRELEATDHYEPMRPFPTNWLEGSFSDFCMALVERENLPKPSSPIDKFCKKGYDKLKLVRSLALPRIIFRRPLELWLVLDRAICLWENGYEVTVCTFCTRNVTPRNLLVMAQK